MSDYTKDLEKKLETARQRVKAGREAKALKKSAPMLFEIMDSEISLSLNRMTSAAPLTHDQYLAEYGQIKGIQRVRDLINSKEAEEVAASEHATAIEKQLNQFKNDKKAS